MRHPKLSLLLLSIMCTACGGGGGTAPPPPSPAFEPCGQQTFTINGSIGMRTISSKQGTLDETSTSVTWKTPPDTTDSGNTGIDDVTFTDSTTHDPNTDERRFANQAQNGSFTITVSGVINADCTGNGTWKVTNAPGTEVGHGTWTMP